MHWNRRIALAVLVALAALLSLDTGLHAAEAVLRVQTALPKRHDLSQSFLDLFVDKVNAAGKGVVQVQYIGGPEVNPPNKAAQALERGVIDMLHSPVAYYAGITPQGLALMASNKTPAEVRANGGMDIIAKVWKEKLNAKIVAWGEWGAQFHLYLVKEPPLNGEGKVDLTGFKMRTTGAYRPLLNALGASTVEMPVSDVYTALQRGVVDGFGWPTVGLGAMGLGKAVKYRLDPPFYHLANLVIVNYDKWNALSKEAQDVLLKVGAEYEQASIDRMHEAGAKDGEVVMKEGVHIFKLEGKARKAYLAAAYGSMWNRIADRLPKDEVQQLQSKMYEEE